MVDHMKTITIHVSEPVYRELQTYARRQDRTASELIREAMAQYVHERVRAEGSLRSLPPLDLGKVTRPVTRNDDLLGEMTRVARD